MFQQRRSTFNTLMLFLYKYCGMIRKTHRPHCGLRYKNFESASGLRHEICSCQPIFFCRNSITSEFPNYNTFVPNYTKLCTCTNHIFKYSPLLVSNAKQPGAAFLSVVQTTLLKQLRNVRISYIML